MNLKKSDILQVNVTAIAGIMILLTISSIQPETSSLLNSSKYVTFTAWIMIIPFAVSAFFVISSEITISKKLEISKSDELKQIGFIRNSLFFMAGGFGYIIVFLGVYAILKLF